MKPVATQDPLSGVGEFRKVVGEWFGRVGRDYPWRRARDPYLVLVSEMMLQQTRIETVLGRGYYARWVERFPDVEALAAAGEDEVLKAWEGLGYYRRARNLWAAARVIVEELGGEFPRDWVRLRALPGVGDYTAGAVLAFACNEPVAVVDGNVARVLARLFDYREPVDGTAGKRQLEEWSLRLVDPLRAREFQSGLMELGQRVCTARNPACGECPVARFCGTREPETLPVKRGRVEVVAAEEWVLWLREGGRFFLEREVGTRRRGLWRLPAVAAGQGGEVLLRMKYAITKYQVTMQVLRGGAADGEGRAGGNWFREEELESLALGSPYRRAVERLLRLEREGDLWLAGK